MSAQRSCTNALPLSWQGMKGKAIALPFTPERARGLGMRRHGLSSRIDSPQTPLPGAGGQLRPTPLSGRSFCLYTSRQGPDRAFRPEWQGVETRPRCCGAPVPIAFLPAIRARDTAMPASWRDGA